MKTADLDIFQDEIMEMFYNTYKDVGILYHSFTELKRNNTCAYALYDGKKAVGGYILFWLSKHGTKISTVISKDSIIGREYVIPKIIELLKVNGIYGEFSLKLEYLLRKAGVKNITDHSQILKFVKIKEDAIFTEDDPRRKEYPLNGELSPIGSYLRVVGTNGIQRKSLYGRPCLSGKFNIMGCFRKCID